jgi:SAM-dependent methyltransferase
MDPSAIDLPAGSVDFIVAIDLLDELAEPRGFLKEALRLLGPKGALVASISNDPRSGAPLRDRTGDGLRALLGDYFRRVILCGQRPVGDEIHVLPGDFDPDLDLAVLAMALQPQLIPFTFDVASADASRTARAYDRKAA